MRMVLATRVLHVDHMIDYSHSSRMDRLQDVDSAHLDKTGARGDPIHVRKHGTVRITDDESETYGDMAWISKMRLRQSNDRLRSRLRIRVHGGRPGNRDYEIL